MQKVGGGPAAQRVNRRRIHATRLFAGLERHPVATAASVALVVRLVLVAASSAFEQFALDDDTYQQLASDMADGEISHWGESTYNLFWRTVTFVGPVTLLYKVFGAESSVGQIYVALIGTGVVALTTWLALQFLTARAAMLTGVCLALIPSQAFWSAQLMKDASVWFGLVVVALGVAKANRTTGATLALAIFAIAMGLTSLAFLRAQTVVVAAWAATAAAAFGTAPQRVIRIACVAAMALAIPFAVGLGPAGLGLVTNPGSLQEIRFRMAQGANTSIVETTERVDATETPVAATGSERPQSEGREGSTEGDTGDPLDRGAPGASDGDDQAELVANLAHLPRGLSVMLFEPLPLPFTGSISLRLARLESIIWYPLLAFAFIGLIESRRHLHALLFPILAGGGILIVYALTEGNIGTAHRHRGEFVWVVVLLAGLGFSAVRTRRRRPRDLEAES